MIKVEITLSNGMTALCVGHNADESSIMKVDGDVVEIDDEIGGLLIKRRQARLYYDPSAAAVAKEEARVEAQAAATAPKKKV